LTALDIATALYTFSDVHCLLCVVSELQYELISKSAVS